MDRAKAKLVREKLQEVLDTFMVDLGVKASIGAGSFTSTSLTLKVEFGEMVDGKVMDKNAQSYGAMAELMGLPKDGLGKPFLFRGSRYEITGLNPKASRFPVNAKRVPDGKEFRFPVDIVCRGLETKPATPGHKRPESEILEDLRQVECDLSPENLCCDGELSRSAVNIKLVQLNRRKASLIAELGRNPTDNELYPLEEAWEASGLQPIK